MKKYKILIFITVIATLLFSLQSYAQGVDKIAQTGMKWLDIPRVHALWQPRHSGNLYVGTPAGLYLSRDNAATWEDTSLVLQDSGVIRSEIGGAGYLEAYWLGRYLGFITDEEAERIWWEDSN